MKYITISFGVQHNSELLSYYHAYFSTSSFLIIMHILALKSILLFIVLESKETKRIKYVVSCVCDCAWTAHPGHRHHIMLRATINILCINLCSVLFAWKNISTVCWEIGLFSNFNALNVQLRSKWFLFSDRTKQMLNIDVRNRWRKRYISSNLLFTRHKLTM